MTIKRTILDVNEGGVHAVFTALGITIRTPRLPTYAECEHFAKASLKAARHTSVEIEILEEEATPSAIYTRNGEGTEWLYLGTTQSESIGEALVRYQSVADGTQHAIPIKEFAQLFTPKPPQAPLEEQAP